jgi:hypothetical protein
MILKPVALSAQLKRAPVIEATDQRTTSGPTEPILRAKGRRHDRTHDPRNAKNNP